MGLTPVEVALKFGGGLVGGGSSVVEGLVGKGLGVEGGWDNVDYPPGGGTGAAV